MKKALPNGHDGGKIRTINKTIQNKNALKRTSRFQKAYRELSAGARQQRHGTELLSKQLAETKGVGGAGAWPLTDRRVST